MSLDDAKRHAMLLTTTPPAPVPWQERLRNLLRYPERGEIQSFLGDTALPAMHQFAKELTSYGLDVDVIDDRAENGAVRLEVTHGEELDFVYQVVNRPHPLPSDAVVGKAIEDLSETERYHRAEVHFTEGSQDYDVMGWTRDQVIADLLEQYEKHLHFLHVLR